MNDTRRRTYLSAIAVIIVVVVGIYFVLESGQITQPKPAQLTILGLSAKSTTSIPADTSWCTLLEIVLGNIGDQDGSFTVILKDNGLNYKTEVVNIASKFQKTLEWQYSSSIIGDHKLSINEASNTLTVKVLPICTTKQIHDDYDNNEISAEQKYKDKNFFVTGKISDFGKSILGNPYVMLDGILYFQCLFEKDMETELATFNKGDQVIIRGKGSGYFIYPMMKDCDLINIS